MEQLKNKLEQLNEESKWGELREDNYGYASDQERLAKRGMEDWELVEKIPESQNKVPYWFMAVVVSVLLVGVGLSFPFWGLRPGVEVRWTEWVFEPGFLGSLVYIAVATAFVYYMVNLYGTSPGGKLDSDKGKQTEEGRGND